MGLLFVFRWGLPSQAWASVVRDVKVRLGLWFCVSLISPLAVCFKWFDGTLSQAASPKAAAGKNASDETQELLSACGVDSADHGKVRPQPVCIRGLAGLRFCLCSEARSCCVCG